MAAPTARVSMWAVPAAASSAWLIECIDRLAHLAGSRSFAPHVTLVGDASRAPNDAEVRAALEHVRARPLALLGVDDEDARFRCVTLRCASAPVAVLRERLLQVVGDAAPGPYRPHVSLLYADRPAAARRALLAAAGLPDPLPPLAIDAVAAWDTSSEDWSRWRELARWPL